MDVSEEKLENREFMGIPKISFNGENYEQNKSGYHDFCMPTLVVFLVLQWEFTNHGGLMGVNGCLPNRWHLPSQSWGTKSEFDCLSCSFSPLVDGQLCVYTCIIIYIYMYVYNE